MPADPAAQAFLSDVAELVDNQLKYAEAEGKPVSKTGGRALRQMNKGSAKI